MRFEVVRIASDFVLLGKYYLLEYLIMSLIIISYIHDLNFFSWLNKCISVVVSVIYSTRWEPLLHCSVAP